MKEGTSHILSVFVVVVFLLFVSCILPWKQACTPWPHAISLSIHHKEPSPPGVLFTSLKSKVCLSFSY